MPDVLAVLLAVAALAAAGAWAWELKRERLRKDMDDGIAPLRGNLHLNRVWGNVQTGRPGVGAPSRP